MRAHKGVVRRAAGAPSPSAWLPSPLNEAVSCSSSRRAALNSSSASATTTSASAPSIDPPTTEMAANASSSSSPSSPRRKRRLAPSSRPVGAALDRWGRVVPASHRMLEFLGATPRSAAVEPATVTATSSSPSAVFSALQLARFYLGSGDLRAAQEVLYALQDGRLSGGSSLPQQGPPLPAGLLRPLYQTLVSELCRRGDAPGAIEAARRMLKAGGQQQQAAGVGKELLAKLIRASKSGEALTTVLTELSPAPGAWREHAESCRAVLEARAAAPVQQQEVGAVPSLEEAWTALADHGAPHLPAHRVLIEGLAARGSVERLAEAVDAFAAAAAATAASTTTPEQDRLERERALLAAGAALLRAKDAGAALGRVLQALPIAGTGPYVALMATARGHEQLDAVFEAAQAANPGPLPLGLILGYCRAALQQPTAQAEPALDRALGLLRGLKAGAAWAAEARPEEVGAVLDALCEKGLREEAKALQQLAGPTFPSPPPVALARALLKCAALEGRPGRAIALLRRVAEEEGEGGRPGDYEAVLGALASMELPPPTAREAALAESPLDFLAWAFEGLRKSIGDGGGAVTPTAVRLALGILRRACEWPEEGGGAGVDKEVSGGSVRHREAFVQRAFALVSRLVAQGHETDDALCEALVGVAVWGVSLQRATDVVRQMEATGAAKPVLARAQGLLIGSLAGRGMLMEAEEWLVKMVTLTGEGPTPPVLDAFARAYALEGNVPSGLSMLQGCFNQYGARPSMPAFERLFARCLDDGDPYEAQRAVTIAQQLWAGDEAGLAWVQGLEGRLAAHDFSEPSGSGSEAAPNGTTDEGK